MINCQDIAYSIDGVKIIDQINLSVASGEKLALVGPSGCGKSTILKMILNSIKSYTGQIKIDCQQIAYMPQNDLLLPWLTIGENIHLVNEAKGLAYDEKKIQNQLDLFKVAVKTKDYPHELSGGMKSRVNLIRALNMSEELILLDEPFSKLDYLTHLELTDWFKGELIKTNLSMLLVTHNIDEAIKLCDRIIVLSAKPAHITHEFVTNDYQSEKLKEKIIDVLI